MSHHGHSHDTGAESNSRLVLWSLILIVALYALTAIPGWPQRGTKLTLGHDGHDAHAVTDDHDEHAESGAHDDAEHAESATSHGEQASGEPPLWAVIPFVLLLGAIAVLPLSPLEHWWESNANRFLVAAVLGLVTLAYYALLHDSSVERHFLGHRVIERSDSALDWRLPWTIIQNALLNEYIPFIVLLFSLYTISGGIRITGDLAAHPLTNTTFIAVGGLLASFIGTTGAAMLLIRPLLATNRERKHVKHTVVFFIFVVCNCGGCLLPIGDPPLFLGYLQGVDFLWTAQALWSHWLVVNVALLVIYFLWDHFFHYPHETRRDIARDETEIRPLRFHGLWPNVPLLVGVVLSVALLDPSKGIPGVEWRPWLYMREIAQLSLVALSLALGSDRVRRENHFNYAAIVEVAALFFGIFLCMQPALQILNVRGPSLGIDTPFKFFWITGSLSAVLDNAPTYLVFFQTARTLPAEGVETMAGVAVDLLTAISLGAVFMGAMTYIGNGPNFMVKSIAETSGVKMPSFFGYMAYSCSVLLPIFAVVSWLML